MLCLEKKEMRFFIRGSYADASDHAVFPIAVNKTARKEGKKYEEET
jgi:hypothetical protein